MLVIGLARKKNSGKTTIAEMLKKKFDVPAMIVSFSDQIKLNLATRNSEIDIINCCRRKSSYLRRRLQVEGTENGRDVYGQDIWIRYTENFIKMQNEKNKFEVFIIDDCRFENEAEWIENKMNGALIKVVSDSNDIDCHISENSLENHQFKYQIINEKDNKDNLYSHVENVFNQVIGARASKNSAQSPRSG